MKVNITLLITITRAADAKRDPADGPSGAGAVDIEANPGSEIPRRRAARQCRDGRALSNGPGPFVRAWPTRLAAGLGLENVPGRPSGPAPRDRHNPIRWF